MKYSASSKARIVLKNSRNKFQLLQRIQVSNGRDTDQAFSRLLPQRFGFTTKAVHTGFAVDKVALRQVFLRVLQSYPDGITPPLLHINSCVVWEMVKGTIMSRDEVSPHCNNCSTEVSVLNYYIR